MQRRKYVVRGMVQGVGFRPFVHQLAAKLHLSGFVKNHSGWVEIQVQGQPDRLEQFAQALLELKPYPALIAELHWETLPCRPEVSSSLADFSIVESCGDAEETVWMAPDLATCDECLRELDDAHNRRYRYPFICCAVCGPRLTIALGAPYDRAMTTMARFPMCAACAQEYEDPSNRRFHAQSIACPACGPQVSLWNAAGNRVDAGEAIALMGAAVISGQIGAIKGLGGYHLICRADDEQVVNELRRRKHRYEKPLAVMVASIAAAHELCFLTEKESASLASVARPIVLASRRSTCVGGPRIAASVAPWTQELGLLLPYTPLHVLLLQELGGIPMVVTSGNVSDEPIVTDEAAAIERLRGIADWYLTHDRPIRVRCEDSVVRVQCGFEQSLRRSRGYAPLPISLFPAFSGKLLAVGGHLKNVFALSSQGFAVLSHHLGDLGDVAARRDLCNDIALYEQLFSICPQLIVHDQHPEYGSTLYAQERAHRDGIPLLSVQHHHAHLASCMAENQLQGEVLGVVFDGSGLGDDGTVWGGEFLLGGYSRFRRVACLRPVLLPGGDEAARQIWRIGLSYQRDANCDSGRTSLRDLPEQSRQVVETMMERDLHSPMTSSAGRLFDAVAAIVGLRHSVSYEGQAALELESLARDVVCDEAYPFRIDRRLSDLLQIDTRPMIAAIVDDMEQSLPLDVISRQFHNTVVQAIVDVCQSIRRESGVNRVVLSGGVMVNTVLSSQIDRQLGGLGFEIYMHRRVPPNDGGLCLGQLAVAAHAISMGEISV